MSKQEKATIVIVGQPAWREAVEQMLQTLGYKTVQYTVQESYVTRLVDDHAALIMVDEAVADWQFWITAARTNAATRRIPVLVVSDDAQRRQAAQDAGATFVMQPDFLRTELPVILQKYGRVQADAERDLMASQCSQPLPQAAREAIALFNAGEFYKQHDAFEALWMAEEGPVRNLYRAVLQVGVGYFQITRGNWRGAMKMLLRCIQWLNVLPDVCQGIDVAGLRADVMSIRAALEEIGEDGDLAHFDQALLRPVNIID